MNDLCRVPTCRQRRRARGLCIGHYDQWYRLRRHDDIQTLMPPEQRYGDGPLVCVCDTPRPGRNDECRTCFRVIAEHVHRRRREWLQDAS